MKINFRSVVQNILSGCVGGLLVIGIAHAETEQTATSPKVITANKFVIVDSAGRHRGFFGMDVTSEAPMLYLNTMEDKYRCVLSAASSEVGLVMGSNTTKVTLQTQDEQGAMVTSSSGKDRFAMLAATPTDQSIAAKGNSPHIGLYDDNSKTIWHQQ